MNIRTVQWEGIDIEKGREGGRVGKRYGGGLIHTMYWYVCTIHILSRHMCVLVVLGRRWGARSITVGGREGER